MALGDVWQLVLVHDYLNQQCRSVWHFLQGFTGDGVPAANNLAEAFLDTLMPAVGQGLRGSFIMNTVFYRSLEITNLFNPGVFVDYTQGLPQQGGAGAAEGMPPFVAYNIRSSRERRDIRRGFKRLVGVPETYGQNGAVQSSVVDLVKTQIADKLSGAWTDSATPEQEWYLVVVKRIEYLTDEGKRAYRLPNAPEEAEYFRPAEWEIRPVLTTQNSRKIGRGQ